MLAVYYTFMPESSFFLQKHRTFLYAVRVHLHTAKEHSSPEMKAKRGERKLQRNNKANRF